MGRRTVISEKTSSDVVIPYQPRQFPLVLSQSAHDFVAMTQGVSSDFQMSPLAAEQSGVAKLQREAIEEKIEIESLNRLKEVEERAYREAFELGLQEGREHAFTESRNQIELSLGRVENLLSELEHYKTKVLNDHEAHLVRVMTKLAEKIAMQAIQSNPESIRIALEESLKGIEGDERLLIRLSEQDLRFIQQMRGRLGRLDDRLSRVRFEADGQIQPGGCRVESNYGLIDATIPSRVERVWSLMEERMPRLEQRTQGLSGGQSGSEPDADEEPGEES